MKIKIPYKSVVVSSVFLGVLISLQFKTINLENEGMTTSKKGEQLLIELKSLKKESNSLKEQINTIKREIDKYKEDEGDDILKSEIKYYEELAGYTNVKGTGIIVKLIKNSSEDSIIYNYDLILSIVNKLNSAQASAISINGERIVFDTYLDLKDDSLYINNTKIKEPITIKAIGNKETLESALRIKYGIAWEIEKYYNYKVDIKSDDNISISGYDKKIEKLRNIKLEYEKDLEAYEQKSLNEKSVKELMEYELSYLKDVTGESKVIGDGIIITIKDSENDLKENQNPNELIVHDIDILRIVNDLKKAGAIAISINGERLLTLSKIKCSGSTIKVNDTTYGQPFIIKAIGDLNTLKASVTSPQSYTNILQEVYGIYIKVEEKNDIIINSFKKYE